MSLRRATGQAAFAGDFAAARARCTSPCGDRLSPTRGSCAPTPPPRAALPGVAAVLCAGRRGELLSPVVRASSATAWRWPPRRSPSSPGARWTWSSSTSSRCPPCSTPERGAPRRRLGRGAGVGRPRATWTGRSRAPQHVVEGEWSLPFTPAVALEPPLAVTWLDEDRRLVVRTSAESPFRVRGMLADRLSLPAARIRVVRPLVAGGSFGRAELVVEDLCALVTLRTGRPARLALSAEEELTTTPGRPAQRVRVRLGLAGGRLVGARPPAARRSRRRRRGRPGAAALVRPARARPLPSPPPALRGERPCARTARRRALRGVPTPGPRFAVECAVDEAAALARGRRRRRFAGATCAPRGTRAGRLSERSASLPGGTTRGRSPSCCAPECRAAAGRAACRPASAGRTAASGPRDRRRPPGRRAGEPRRRGGLAAPPRRRLLHPRRRPVRRGRDRRGSRTRKRPRRSSGCRRTGSCAPPPTRTPLRSSPATPLRPTSPPAAPSRKRPARRASGSARRGRPSWASPSRRRRCTRVSCARGQGTP